MLVFRCQSCAAAVYFENTRCLSCSHELGFIPEAQAISALEELDGGLWRALAVPQDHQRYRKCRHFSNEAACNWMVADHDPHELCASCRLSRTIPDITQATLRQQWARLEVAKRRLCYSLARLHLPITTREADPAQGLCFDMLTAVAGTPVTTGHQDGVITIDVAEADDAHREQQKARLGEAYRTLLGHLRHEIGHYYWDRLIRGSERCDGFRSLFGDERQDYGEAQKAYYEKGPATDWQQRFISAYASMHPWEDWAESFAHYLHMTDVVESGAQFGLSLSAEPASGAQKVVTLSPIGDDTFERTIRAWIPLTFAINSLNRSMGLPDWYPFTMPPDALAKLRFIHRVIVDAAHAQPGARVQPGAPAQPGAGAQPPPPASGPPPPAGPALRAGPQVAAGKP